MRPLMLMFPVEWLSLLIVGAGMCFIVGARAIGVGLLGFAAALVILPILLAPLFDALPGLVLWALIAGVVVTTGMCVLRWLSSSLIGEAATNHMIGDLAAGAVRRTVSGTAAAAWWVNCLPFRLLHRLFVR